MDSDQSDSDIQSDTTENMNESDMIQISDDIADIIRYYAPLSREHPRNNKKFTFELEMSGPPAHLYFETERDYEVAGENSVQFFLQYLGSFSGVECLEPGKYYCIPVFAYDTVVFPGQRISMVLSSSEFDKINFLTDSNEGCLFGLMFLQLEGKDRTYGVTCEIYEKQTDYYTAVKLKMNLHRWTATVQILPELFLGDPLLSSSANNVKKFFQNKSLIKKIRRFETGSMAWPLFVYDQYIISDMYERAKSLFTQVKVDSIPSDPVALSFWLCNNMFLSEKDRLILFITNSVTDRMQIIEKSMNVTRFIRCKRCRSKLSNCSTLFDTSRQGVQSQYYDPHDFRSCTVHLTLHNAVRITGSPSIEFVPFPGFSCQSAVCSNCDLNLGLQFLARIDSLVPKSFFRLSASSVLIDEFASVLEILSSDRLSGE